VGESGSGKSQLMMGTMGLWPQRTIEGVADYRGTNRGPPKQQLNTIRGRYRSSRSL
jgi:ABC-type dipeptide/oligopeptide/nickel transport system ATPase component